MNNLYLDIGTEAIKAYNNKYSVIYYKENNLFDKEKALKKELEKFKNFNVFLTGSFINSQIKSFSFSRENPSKKISKKEINIFCQNFGKSYFVLETKIQGYKVNNLFSYSGKEIEIKVLLNDFDQEFFKNIFKSIKIIPLPELIAFPEPNCFVIDIGGKESLILEAEQGILKNILKIPFGGNFFSELLVKTFNLSLKDARLLKEDYSNGKLTESTSSKIKEIFKNQEIEENFNFFSKPRYLLGGGSLLPEIKNFFKAKHLWELKNNKNMVKENIEAQCFNCKLLYGKKIF